MWFPHDFNKGTTGILKRDGSFGIKKKNQKTKAINEE